MSYILSIDQGTTGTKALLVNADGEIAGRGYQAHEQFHPADGWVEHDVNEIWQCILDAVAEALKQAKASSKDVKAVTLTNQGETVLAFSKSTGEPLHGAIVWSDRRTAEMAEELAQDAAFEAYVRRVTGLRTDPYFSATKMHWLLDNVDAVRDAHQAGDLCISTLDAWMIYRLTGLNAYISDTSTASRTLLLNVHTLGYDPELLARFGVPAEVLPKVTNTVGMDVTTDPEAFLGISAPIVTSLVDQPAALYGHLCLAEGEAKCTYGTGCFLYMNTGHTPVESHHGMLTTLVWSESGRATYALEGGVYSAGSAIDWLYDIGLVRDRDMFLSLVGEVESAEGAWFVPALTGLAAPYWDSDARGSFIGLSSATRPAHMVNAVLEGIAQRVADVVETMALESGKPLQVLSVDGGLTNIPKLMQLQADLLGIPLEVPADHDATALGAAFMAGVHLGVMDIEVLKARRTVAARYEPQATEQWRHRRRDAWKEVISHVRAMGKIHS